MSDCVKECSWSSSLTRPSKPIVSFYDKQFPKDTLCHFKNSLIMEDLQLLITWSMNNKNRQRNSLYSLSKELNLNSPRQWVAYPGCRYDVKMMIVSKYLPLVCPPVTRVTSCVRHHHHLLPFKSIIEFFDSFFLITTSRIGSKNKILFKRIPHSNKPHIECPISVTNSDTSHQYMETYGIRQHPSSLGIAVTMLLLVLLLFLLRWSNRPAPSRNWKTLRWSNKACLISTLDPTRTPLADILLPCLLIHLALCVLASEHTLYWDLPPINSPGRFLRLYFTANCLRTTADTTRLNK